MVTSLIFTRMIVTPVLVAPLMVTPLMVSPSIVILLMVTLLMVTLLTVTPLMETARMLAQQSSFDSSCKGIVCLSNWAPLRADGRQFDFEILFNEAWQNLDHWYRTQKFEYPPPDEVVPSAGVGVIDNIIADLRNWSSTLLTNGTERGLVLQRVKDLQGLKAEITGAQHTPHRYKNRARENNVWV